MRHLVRNGTVLALVAAIISGLSIFYNKLVVVKGIDPLIFNILKNGGVGVVLSIFVVTSGKWKLFIKLPKKQWMYLILIAVVGGSIPFILYFDGLRTVSAINANLIHKTLFIWVALMALPILHERLTLWQVIGYVLVAWSNVLIGGFTGFKLTTAELMILAATLLWSVENIIAKITLKGLDSIVVAWGRMFLGALVLVGIAGVQGKLPFILKVTPNEFLVTSGSIIFLTGYVVSWYRALKLAPATLVTSILIVATPITNILSAIFITRKFPNDQVIQAVIMVVGLAIITLFAKRPTKEHLPIQTT